jgi:hypothetical protein
MAEPPDSWTFEAQPLPEPSIQGAAPAAPNPAPAAGPAAPTSFLAPPQAPDELGRFGTYRILEVLGQGGMGVVFRAAEAVTGRTVALKVLRPEVARLPLAKKRFLREARAATGLPPDHVVAIFHVGEEAGLPYLAMEFLPGESLETYLRRSPQVSLDFLLRVGRETAAGLAAAHERGLIHRDVKPGNLWLTQPGGCVKILDFGLVHVLDASMRLTNTGQILGTPSYMAPEQAAGEKLDARADLYSLGVVLYRLCTGRLPIQGLNLFTLVTAIAYQEPPPIRDLNPAIPAAVADLVHRLLAKEPDQRPASAAEVAAALRRLEAAPAPPAEPPPVRNRTARAWWGAGAGLAVAVFLAALLWPARPPEPVASATATVAATAPAATAIPTGADRLRAEDVPAGLRSLHGDGHPERVPEVVAVLGTDQLRVHGQVEALAFHPKAPLLAAGTWARTNPRLGSVHFFDPRTAGPTRPALTGLPGWVRAFAFDPTSPSPFTTPPPASPPRSGGLPPRAGPSRPWPSPGTERAWPPVGTPAWSRSARSPAVRNCALSTSPPTPGLPSSPSAPTSNCWRWPPSKGLASRSTTRPQVRWPAPWGRRPASAWGWPSTRGGRCWPAPTPTARCASGTPKPAPR